MTTCRTATKERVREPVTIIDNNAKALKLIHNAHNYPEQFAVFENQNPTFNLQINSSGLHECRGKMQGYHPLFKPR